MKKGYQAILLSAVMICAVFTFISMAWAAFSTTLTISGTGSVKAQTWNIFFSSASVDSTNTTAKNVSIDSIGSSTGTITLSSLAAQYDTPGQKAVYDITIKSTSSFDAKLTSYVEPTIECKTATGSTYTPTTGKAAYDAITDGNYSGVDSAALVCGFISYDYVVASSGFNGVAMGAPVAACTKLNSLVNTLVLDKTSTTSGDSDIDLVLTVYFDKSLAMNSKALPTQDVSVTIKDLKTAFSQV